MWVMWQRLRKNLKKMLPLFPLRQKKFALPKELKLSVHSGSDKFSLYPHIYSILKKSGSGGTFKDSRNNLAGRSNRARCR